MKLPHSPIIEAVLDIDCDMPAQFDLSALEGRFRDLLRSKYPTFRKQFFEQHKFESKLDSPSEHSLVRGIQALQFVVKDERQIVQFRSQGFSFNRLAPYSTLDDYLAEIHSAWQQFVEVAAPVQVRAVRLRNINRIPLPLTNGAVMIDKYFKNSPNVDDEKLTLVGFLIHYGAIEKETNFTTNVVLAGQPPEQDKVPIILDIMAEWNGRNEVQNWSFLLDKIMALRALKNRVFHNSLTSQCLNLFQ